MTTTEIRTSTRTRPGSPGGACGVTPSIPWPPSRIRRHPLRRISARPNSGAHIVRNRSEESTTALRALVHWHHRRGSCLEFGTDAKHAGGGMNNYYDAFTDALGQSVPPSRFNRTFRNGSSAVMQATPSSLPPDGRSLPAARVDWYALHHGTQRLARLSTLFRVNERLLRAVGPAVCAADSSASPLPTSRSHNPGPIPSAVHLMPGMRPCC